MRLTHKPHVSGFHLQSLENLTVELETDARGEHACSINEIAAKRRGECIHKLGNKQAVSCLSFKHAHKDARAINVYKHIPSSCEVTHGGPFSWPVAHYISHYVFTHIWLLLCTCWGVIYRLSVYTCSLSSSSCSAPPSLKSHFSPYHSICLPVSLPSCLFTLPMYPKETKLLPRQPQLLCTRLPGDWSLWRWSRILKHHGCRRHSFSSSPRQINLHHFFLHSVAVFPSLVTTLEEEKHADL